MWFGTTTRSSKQNVDARGGTATGAQAICLLVGSVVAYSTTFAPWNASALSWIALTPLFWILQSQTPAQGALIGLAWGTGAIWGVGYWVPSALAHYYQQPLWFGYLFAIGASLIFAGSYTAGFAACAAYVSSKRSGLARILTVTCLWVAWELARARLLTGDPWLLSGYGILTYNHLAQTADIGGVYMLSFLIALVNATMAEVIATRPLQRIVPLALMTACILVVANGYGSFRLHQPFPSEPELAIAVVQGNNDVGSQWESKHYGQGLRTYLQLSTDAADSKPRLLVWPENAVTFFLAHEPTYRSIIGRTLSSLNADLIIGTPHFESEDPARPIYFNSAFYLSKNGEIRDRYDKVHLLPFAEYFPLHAIGLLRRNFARVRSFEEGRETRPLDTQFGPIATLICFEGIFPELARSQMNQGASLLVNLSNDAWLGSTIGAEQHLSMVALRAIENRTWVIRATTTGISAIVAPDGRVVARTNSLEKALLQKTVIPMQISTFYKRWGDLFAYACLTFAVIGTATRRH